MENDAAGATAALRAQGPTFLSLAPGKSRTERPASATSLEEPALAAATSTEAVTGLRGTLDLAGGGQTGLPRVFLRAPFIASCWAVCVGCLVLLGWQFEVDLLKRVTPALVAMNPATALLFIACGAALSLAVRPGTSGQTRRTRSLLAGFVVIAAAAELLELSGLIWSPVDELLFAAKIEELHGSFPNRMAPGTSLSFCLVGLSLLMLDRRGYRSGSQAVAVVVCFNALLAMTGYAYGVGPLSGGESYIPMALHTAGTFFLLAVGLFFAVPDAPLSQAFSARDARGVLARQLFPLAAGLTLFLGWVSLWAQRRDLVDPALATALYATVLTVILAALVRWTAAVVGRLEQERTAAYTRVHELSRRKDEMIAVVSHDLCSPLTGFRMVIDLLREKTEPNDELLNLMDHSAKRMVAMVRGLLDVSKLQTEETELEREFLRVSDVIRESIVPLQINANAKEITLAVNVAPDEPVLYVDPLRISQIFNNLLSNAVKFTGHGGSVTVDVRRDGGGVRVAVRDTGLGIDARELPHIFEKFHQTSTKATAGEPGAGLGLAIVRELVLLHHGRIDVSSAVGEGTTFTVFLPQADSPSAGK